MDGGMLKPRPPPSKAAYREVKAMFLPLFTCGQPVVCAACHLPFAISHTFRRPWLRSVNSDGVTISLEQLPAAFYF